MSRRLAIAVALLAASTSGTAAPRAQEPHPRLHHYVFFGLERTRISDRDFLATASIEGAQLKYSWRELEPAAGQYDFTSIRHDLSTLSAAGKRLFVQLQDIAFGTRRPNVPDYLLHDPRYGGGVAPEYTFDDEEKESHPVRDGWVARRWDPAVRARFALLLEALGREFDGRIAGLNLAETSVAFGASGRHFPPGFSNEGYYTSILALMTSARAAFRQSDVIVYANFMPGEALPDDDRGYLRGVYRHAERIGMGVGGPDLLPYRWFQRQNSLRLIAERPAGTVAGLAVQDGNLADVDRRTGTRVTVADLVRIARDELHLDYIFWGTEEPYWSRDVLPYLRALRRSDADAG